MRKQIIVALDLDNQQAVFELVNKLNPAVCYLKIGKELFTLYGPEIVHSLQQRGFEIFLDLKFHDIPNTVYKAVKAAASLGIWMVNVHASGGREMLLAAHQAIEDSQHKPLLIAVTILTSLSPEAVAEIGYSRSLTGQATHLAQLAHDCGLDGVVCSAWETNSIKSATSPGFITVTPGIRLSDSKADDQIRIMTPATAVANGADYLVIGRPITQADNPSEILNNIMQELH